MIASSSALILSFDTSAAHCAAALFSSGAVLSARHEPMQRGQAERLLPLLQEVLEAVGAGWRDLAALAVGTGPGNFTGLRVGVAAARGLGLSTGLPAFGVDGFLARAEGAPLPALACITAPRGLLHARRIGPGLDDAVATVTPHDARRIAADEALALVGEPLDAPPRFSLAEAIARIAARRLAEGPPPERPAPFYVRPADAAPSRHRAPTLLP